MKSLPTAGQLKQEAKRISDGGGATAAELRKRAPRELAVSEIRSREPFASLLPRRVVEVERIIGRMKDKGFDHRQAVHVLDEAGEYTLIDGHTRWEAAQGAGIANVWAYVYQADEFNGDEGVIRYMYHLQFARRNVDETMLYSVYERMAKGGFKGLPHSPGGRKREAIALVLGVSSATIGRCSRIYRAGTEEEKRQARDGEESIGTIEAMISRRLSEEDEVPSMGRGRTELAAPRATSAPREQAPITTAPHAFSDDDRIEEPGEAAPLQDSDTFEPVAVGSDTTIREDDQGYEFGQALPKVIEVFQHALEAMAANSEPEAVISALLLEMVAIGMITQEERMGITEGLIGWNDKS